MIVNREKFQSVIEKLARAGSYGLDTETTGLFEKDRIFAIILADSAGAYYFNFQSYPGLGEEWVLPLDLISQMAPVIENPESLFFIHNAKFDMRMLAKEGLEILGEVHCTNSNERVVKNNYIGHHPYNLETCAERRGLAKDSAVEDYITKNKLYTDLIVPGKDKPLRIKHFDRVPWEIIAPYGQQDAILTLTIGLDQISQLQKMDEFAATGAPGLMPLLQNEYKLTKACYRIEQAGIKIDRPYVTKALEHTLASAKRARGHFELMAEVPYANSPAVLRDVFARAGVKLPTTRTGKPCTKAEVLDEIDHPIAAKIREIREYEKLASTYYSSFLFYADRDDLIHANMRQGGTETSRFSYSDPNLQNLPKEDEEADKAKPFLVRRSFIPRSDEWCLVAIDFKQQEFRMMLDYAGETEMIRLIMDGMDVHDATAEMVGCGRKPAKTLNFGLLYGMGVETLANRLGISIAEAAELRARYFSKLPRVKLLIQSVQTAVKRRGYIWNWFGFRNNLSSSEYAYKIPNHLIQGGCAQVIRVAMVRLADELVGFRSRMLAQVHDELLFEVHKSELGIVPNLQAIMENVYPPKNGLTLECSVEHSWASWAKWDMTKGYPSEKTRNSLQGVLPPTVGEASLLVVGKDSDGSPTGDTGLFGMR